MSISKNNNYKTIKLKIMKTIQITDEIYDKLIEFHKSYNEQTTGFQYYYLYPELKLFLDLLDEIQLSNKKDFKDS